MERRERAGDESQAHCARDSEGDPGRVAFRGRGRPGGGGEHRPPRRARPARSLAPLAARENRLQPPPAPPPPRIADELDVLEMILEGCEEPLERRSDHVLMPYARVLD